MKHSDVFFHECSRGDWWVWRTLMWADTLMFLYCFLHFASCWLSDCHMLWIFPYMQQIFGHQTTRVDFYGYPVIQWFRKNLNPLESFVKRKCVEMTQSRLAQAAMFFNRVPCVSGQFGHAIDFKKWIAWSRAHDFWTSFEPRRYSFKLKVAIGDGRIGTFYSLEVNHQF